jgi:hypothetical protein
METTTMMNPDKTAWLDMTDAEKGSLLLAYHNGEVIEYWWPITDKWIPCKLGPYWLPQVFYRAQPKPLTKPIIDWSHVAQGFNWLVTDEDGEAWLYGSKPWAGNCGGWVEDGEWYARVDILLASYRHGTCDWTDSPVQRPTRTNT